MVKYNSLHEYPTFTDYGVYVVFAIARKKENKSINRNDRHLFRRTATSRKELDENIRSLKRDLEESKYTFRLYMSVNRRDAVSAAFSLRDRINSWTASLLNGDEEMMAKFQRTDSEFRSILQDPEHKDQKNFLIDIDDPSGDQLTKLYNELNQLTEILYTVGTPNGRHFIVEGFNYTEMDLDFEYEVKQDAAVFINYI